MRYCGASSQGNASVSWRAIHSAVGFVVMLIQTSFLRSSPNDDEGIRANRNQRSEQRTGPWRQCPACGSAERCAILARRSTPLDHVLGDARLRDLKSEFEQFAVDTRRTPKRIFDAHPRISARRSVSIDLGSPSQWARISSASNSESRARCQRTSVSGRVTVRTCRIDGNQRYNWMMNQRSLFVS